MGQPLHILGPLRHDCTGCGGCCHGVIVFLKPAEQEKLRVQARELGKPEPVEEGHIAFSHGRCPFQEDDDLCLVHRRYGLAEKPLLCQQYPLVLSRCEGEVRAGVDPGCYDGWKSWRDGPALQPRAGAVEPRPLGAAARRMEGRVLDLLDAPGLGLLQLAALLADERPDAGGLPPRFMRGALAAFQRARMSRGVDPERTGARLAAVLGPLFAHLEALDPSDLPPAPALTAEQQAFAIDVIQRMIFLRMVLGVGPVVVATLGAVGAIACGWSDPAPEVFGPAVAGWARAMRSPAVLEVLGPELSALLPPVVER
ncbi:MAG: YkgJ family cysteine cluster protein [Pseudomonadota bacterium]